MRDFPFFTTGNGVASLILKEVPYSGTAYIRILSTSSPAALLDECVAFCKTVGATLICAADHAILSGYPVYTSIMEMSCCRESLPDTDAALFPVQKSTIATWRDLYNRKMRNVDGASYLTLLDCDKLLKEGNGYFVHRGPLLLGIGVASGNRIDAVISNISGSGKDVVLALNHALSGDRVVLEVASTNTRAIRLYDSLGFIAVREVTKWHKIL